MGPRHNMQTNKCNRHNQLGALFISTQGLGHSLQGFADCQQGEKQKDFSGGVIPKVRGGKFLGS